MKIGVVGSINMDMVVGAPRIPLKGETLMGSTLNYNSGGKGANQAVAIARLGGEVVMFGAVGNDDNGKNLVSALKDEKVNTDFIKVMDNENTGLAVITVGEGDNTIIVISGANNCVDISYINQIKDELLTCEMVIMQNEVPSATNDYVAKLCKESGIKTLLNPAPARELSDSLIGNVNFLTPNEHEASLIFEQPTEALLKYKEKLIITKGSEGVSIGLLNGEILNVPCRKSQVVDTTGAGDTFNGAFAYALTNNYSLELALKFANITAGFSTEKHGAQGGMPNLNTVLKEME